jgi:NADPH:quinone reductase-like Zn-dependent oxidoreductase
VAFTESDRADLWSLAELRAQDRARTVIDSTLPLVNLAAALQRSSGGHARGKIVVAVGQRTL